MEQEQLFLLRLALAEGIGPYTRYKMYRYACELQDFTLTGDHLSHLLKNRRSLPRFLTSFSSAEHDVRHVAQTQPLLFFTDAEYPPLLKEITDPPLVLFYRGQRELLQRPKLALVGARDCSREASRVVRALLPELIEKNYVIVSGLARGVDTEAHKAAITLGGQTIAVIGCGLDTSYPGENAALQQFMGKRQLILSEYPKGARPERYHFPQRNRLIAGLSVGVCVVEARQQSGSLITAQLALDYGREVFAVPGAILSGRSSGCHQLIQDGAKCTQTAQDILPEIEQFHSPQRINP